MAFDIRALVEASNCGECANEEQKKNVALYLLNQLVENGGIGGGGLHNLLSLTHPDTVPSAPLRGSLVVGNATPDWEALLIGAAGTVLTSNGTDASWTALPGSFTGFANPTASVGLVAVNGVATTAMRSDAAPPIDVTISPTWTGTHTFTASATIFGSAANALNAIQIVPPAALGSNMVDLFSDGGPGYNAMRKYFSSPFQVEIASSGSIDFVTDSNGNETGATVKFLTNALRGGVQTTLFTFNDNGSLVCTPTAALAIKLDPFGAVAGNTSEIRFLELVAGGTNYTGFKAPDAMAASEIYVLPDAAPAANRFLRAGAVAGGVSTLSWAQVSLTADVSGILPVANGGSGASTAFTAGSVIFAGAAGVYSQDNANLFWDDTNNRLGIGTASPVTGLSVNGVVTLFPIATVFTSSTSNPSIYAASDTFNAVAGNFGLLVLEGRSGGSAKSIIFVTGSTPTERMRVLETGNVSIATNIVIPSTTSTVGTFIQGSDRFIHTFGTQNIFVGRLAGNFTLSGVMNAAIGANVLTVLTTGGSNVGIATNALVANTTGIGNCGIGVSALAANIDGNANMAIGVSSLANNVSGSNNVSIGYQSGFNLTGGSGNIIIGFNIHAPTTTSSNTLTIGNLIFGTAVNGDTTTLATGSIGIGVITPLAKFHVTNSNAATVATIIKAAAAQSANLTEWQSSAAVVLAFVSPLGNVSANQLLLPSTTSATVGGIYFGGIRVMFDFGNSNIFVGSGAANMTMTGGGNTVLGNGAFIANTSGEFNFGIGYQTLRSNTTGSQNVANGTQALFSNTTGGLNTASGAFASFSNTTGANNVAIGNSALYTNISGSGNVSIGLQSLILGTGSNNIALGTGAANNLTTGSNNIVIGHDIDSPTATNSNTLTIGNLIFGAGIDGTGTTLSSGGIGVRVIAPTAKLHLCAGTTVASTAPLKFNTGTSMTAAEAGAVEFTTDDLFFTITTGASRKRLLMADATAGLTSGKMPVATTNGRLIDLTASSAYTPTNVTTDRSYDANATTLDELSDVVGTMIADLQSKGILG